MYYKAVEKANIIWEVLLCSLISYLCSLITADRLAQSRNINIVLTI
jgi:hypothetical protein